MRHHLLSIFTKRHDRRHRSKGNQKKRTRLGSSLVLVLLLVGIGSLILTRLPAGPGEVLSSDQKRASEWEPEISPMGAIARGDVPMPNVEELAQRASAVEVPTGSPLGLQGNDKLVHSPNAVDFQSETTIAKNGNAVVVGFSDIRGFFLSPISVSGYAFSADGGVTWTDGGQLPTQGASDRVFGDPDVKTWTDGSGQAHFFFSSIYSTSTGANSLCLHHSIDGGATWSAPREVTSATSFFDFADKEFMDVDPETGRIFISWTNFGSPTTMRVTYSDDMGFTWSAPVAFGNIGQGSVPRADGSSDNVYIAWRRSIDIQFVRSTDNGVTWSAPTAIVGGLTNPMNPYGSDRIGGFPAMDIDDTNGNIYITYATRNLFPDFSDVYFIRSTDGGLTFSAPVALNANPGGDRSQFSNWNSVDQTDGRIDVIWYDQINGLGTSDITDVFHTHSHDGGLTWCCPTPLTDRPFHAEYGNTTSQPNIGDYNQCFSDGGRLYVSFAKTGEASPTTFAPDTYVDVSENITCDAPIRFRGLNFVDIGCSSNNGYLEPTENVSLFVTIEQYSACLGGISNILGTLSTATPGVTVLNAVETFGNLAGLGSSNSSFNPFLFSIDGAFNCGDDIDFLLTLTSSAGSALVPFRMKVGRPVATPLLSENFDGVSAPALPGGWTSSFVAGSANPWRTSTTFAASGPNSAFCADISVTSLNELVSPVIAVPANCDLLDVTFDITHNIELDFDRKAWDGALLRVRINGGSKQLAGAFASLFQPFYPWQMNRQSSSSQPLQDLSCWSSDVTPNFNQVHLQFPGVGGDNVELLWDMGTDASVGTPTGMFVDNVDVRSIEFVCDCSDTTVPVLVQSFEARPVAAGVELRWDIEADEAIAGFNIVRREAGAAFEDVVNGGRLVAPHERRYMDTTVRGGQTYEYTLVVVTAAGEEVRSYGVTARPLGASLALRQNYPNPFNPTTTIGFELPEESHVTLKVFDGQGKLVATLLNGLLPAGAREIVWDGRNDEGNFVGTGVYFYQLTAGKDVLKKKMVLLK